MTNVGKSALSKRKAPARKPTKRKSKDKPKRPLSAYNYFFKEERMKIIKAVNCEDEIYQKKIDPDLNEELILKLRKDGGKVSFEELGKLIGRRWKEIKSEPLAYCSLLAEGDKGRYKIEMKAFKKKQEEMRNNEANIRSSEIHYIAHPQEHYHMPPYMQRYSQIPAPPSAMNGGHTSFMPSYHMELNVAHGYGQMPMIGDYNPYNMSGHPPVNEGQFEKYAPPLNDNSSTYANTSRSYPLNNESQPPSRYSQGEYSSYYPEACTSEQYSYALHAHIPTSDLSYHNDRGF